MGATSTLAEQMELAKVYCPDVLKRAVSRRLREPVDQFIIRARKEIAQELTEEFWEAIRKAKSG